MKKTLLPAVFLLVFILIFAVVGLRKSQGQNSGCSLASTDCASLYISYLGQNLSLKLFICDFYDCRGGNSRIRTIDDSGYFQFYSDIAVGLDDLPLIAYLVLEDTGSNVRSIIKVAHCGDKLCTPALITQNQVVVQDNLSIGLLSLDIISSGLPVISYHDPLIEDLKIVLCAEPDCSIVNPPVTVDSSGDVGNGNKLIAWRTLDGMPIIAYLDSDNLKFSHCTALDCGSFDIQRTLDVVGNTSAISLALDPQTLEPVIVYDDTFNRSLKFVRCADYRCASNFRPVVVDYHGDFAAYPSVTFGTDNNPIISYGLLNGALKIIHCNDPYCALFDSPTILDTRGMRNSIAITEDNMPVISYFYPPTDDLKFIHCRSVDCFSFDLPATLDYEGNAGNFNSIDASHF